ncbi:hypothetical protein [Methylocystis parvus]|uniref:hypothetical protein n=1 Tax=Methylocystis parvus TaxID=134 RepID=UPI003C71B7E6
MFETVRSRLRAALGLKRVWLAVLVLAAAAAALLEILTADHEKMLVLSTMAPGQTGETHAALALFSQAYSSDPIVFSGRVATLRRLRQGGKPNSWECAWIVWNYQDNDHFYYLALKPDGWELGKRDPAYPGGQRFMATGSQPFPVGAWTTFKVSQLENLIVVTADNRKLASVIDTQPPIYTSGQIGLYTEDAVAALARVTSPIVEDFRTYQQQNTKVDGSAFGGWTLPFLGYGSAAIEPVSFPDEDESARQPSAFSVSLPRRNQ